jgi:hypothetical protein
MILALIAGLIGLTILAIVLRGLWVRAGLSVRQTILTVGVGLLVLLVVGLAAAGRLNWIVAALAALIPFVRQLVGLGRLVPWLKSLFARNPSHPNTGSNSASGAASTTTESPFFRMTLHHASGHMDGEIKQGRHQHRFLSELSLVELVGLFGDVQDYDSQRLLESYLDHHYPEWRRNRPNETTAQQTGMSRREALEALGLTDGAAREDIVAAHRRLIQRLHPDRGGSTYLAALLNQAKDVLIDDR